MSAVLDAPVRDAASEVDAEKPLLFQVWIDLCFGKPPADWWWNTPPQPLKGALQEAAEARAEEWVVVVMPEGQNPRPDGRWDNP